jgi:polyhydroxyalkanoate synthesis regulator phasin
MACKEVKNFLQSSLKSLQIFCSGKKGGKPMSRSKYRKLILDLVKEGKITTLQEFATLFNLANKLPRQPKVKG